MIQVDENIRLKGVVGIYKVGMEQVKKIDKILVKQNVEKLHFESKERQQELKIFIGLLPVIKTLGLGTNKEPKVDIYLDATSFGRKKPEIRITENSSLYRALKRLIE